MEIKDTVTIVKDCVEKLSDDFHNNPNIYFCESDLQSSLFSLLLEKLDTRCSIKQTFVWGTFKPKKVQKIITRSVHSELLLPEGRIDLAVLDLEKIVFAVNSKGHNPGIRIEEGNHIFIEIKASRTSRSSITSKKQWQKLILADIEKLNKYKHQCLMLCFDFENLFGEMEISSIRDKTNKNIELYYVNTCYEDNYFC